MKAVQIWALSIFASILILPTLFWLIYFKPPFAMQWNLSFLPALNAVINALASICLVIGYLAILKKDEAKHKRFMLTALGFSSLFLIGYLIYHAFYGDILFTGQGLIRPIYFSILISSLAYTLCLAVTRGFVSAVLLFYFYPLLILESPYSCS